jgi:hypothetical protein
MFSQLTRYASELDVQIDDAEMDIRMNYDTRGKLGIADVTPRSKVSPMFLKFRVPLRLRRYKSWSG